MKVWFVRQWRNHRPGSLADLFDNVASMLCRRGVCRPYAEQAYETTALAAVPEKRKRGRPRKIR